MKHVNLLFLSFIFSSVTICAQTWQSIGSTSASVTTANFSCLVVDDDIPYIAYQDGDQSNKVTVKKFVNGAWTTVGNAGFTAGGATYIKLAIYNHIPYVAYVDYSVAQKISVMKFNGTAWVQVGNAGFSEGVTAHIDLLIDNSGTPHVAIEDYTYGNRLSVFYFNGTNWIQKGGRGFSYGTAYYTSLAKDSNGDIYVACVEFNNASQIRVFKHSSSTGWQELGAYASGANCWHVSLALDGTTPYLAYCEAGTTGLVKVRKFINGAWANMANPSTLAPCSWANMKIKNGVIYLAYAETANLNPTLKSYVGERWTTVGGSAIASVTANYINVDLKSDGTPVVAFKNLSNSNKIATYFYGTSITTDVNETSIATAGFYTDQTTDRIFFKDTTPAHKQVLSIDGKLLLSSTGNEMSISDLRAGIYIVRITDEQGHVSGGKFIKK